MEKISGYKLALDVLNHPGGGVEALLRLSGGAESSWLELKAGMDLLPDDKTKGYTQKDLYWNIACAIIEIMNTSGGILLIGVEDHTHNAVPLQDNDPRHVIEKDGLEAYRRDEILKRIWPDEKIWKTSKQKWDIKEPVPENLVEVIGWKYQDKDIAVVLIKPAPKCIRVWRDDEVEQILARKPGEIGGKMQIKGGRQMDDYQSSREIETDLLGHLYEKFLAEAQQEELPAQINRKIEEYYVRFEERIRRQRIFDLFCFTELDASGGDTGENEEEDDFMAPRADEFFESDDWLNDDDSEEEEEEDPDSDEDDEEDDDSDDEEEEDDRFVFHEKRSGDLLSLMKEIPRIAVLGEPGGGKTTSLIHFTMQFHTQEQTQQILAVFIRMGRWKDGGSIQELIARETELSEPEWQALIQQNRLYLIIDAVNECPDAGQFPMALRLAEKVFGCPFVDAIPKYAGSLENPFHHHLLVKNLFFNPEVVSMREKYLSFREKWQEMDQHPWELILLYRGLLLAKKDPEASKQIFSSLWKFYETEKGAIMHLLEMFARAAYGSTFQTKEQEEQIEKLCQSVRTSLPEADKYCRAILDNMGSFEKISSVLPFNYK